MKQHFYIMAPTKTKISFICSSSAYGSCKPYSNSFAVLYIKGLPCKSRIDSSRLSKRPTQFSQTSPLKTKFYEWQTNTGQYSKISFQNNCEENFFSIYQIVRFWIDVHKIRPQVQFIHTQNSIYVSLQLKQRQNALVH